MSYPMTLSEIETYLRKAARASGLEWGIAEEAGKAARWLAAFDLPGPELMLEHLQSLEGRDYRELIPNCERQSWEAPGGAMCPVIAGAALADRSASVLGGEPILLGAVAYPLLLAAMLSQAAGFHRATFSLGWDRLRVSCFADGIAIDGDREALLAAETGAVTCRHEAATVPAQLPSTRAYRIDEELFARIDALALRTYVPASEESRAGAGAGLTDND